MTTSTERADVVVVGGGIAGASLGTALAREDLDVLVLERDRTYQDRNKGETMMPWGWAEVRRLGLTDVLEDAAGFPNPAWVYTSPEGQQVPIPVGELRPDAPGSYSIGHVTARQALADAADKAGADVRFGATDIDLHGDDRGEVSWEQDGVRHRIRTRLVVGADGRGSRMRHHLGLDLQRSERTHVIASMLVEDTGDLDDNVQFSAWDEQLLLAIPQAADRARLYLVSHDDRYTGTTDAAAMLDACRSAPIADPGRFTDTTPVGPCATYGGEDTWVQHPVADGAVLIGDAAGYNSPIIGQGLSLALRDARVLTELLLDAERWSTDRLTPYVTQRAERLRRVRFVAQLWPHLWLRPDDEIPRPSEHPRLQELLIGIFTGYDDAPEEWFTEQTARELREQAAPTSRHDPARV